MQLTVKERDEIRSIINNFRDVHKEIDTLENELLVIEKKREDLTANLREIRDKERTLVESLKNKYGANTSLDLETLQLIKS